MLSKLARHKFGWQRSSAKKRGILWQLTFEQWYHWWLSNGIDKNLDQQPMHANKLCMCRYNDSGAYTLSNIYCDTNSNNVRTQNKLRHGQKQVHTPGGIFASRNLAAHTLGISPNYLSTLIRKKPGEYYYLP